MSTPWSALLLKYPDGLYKIQHHNCSYKVTPFICEFESFIAQNECSHLKKKKSSTQVLIAKSNFISSYRAGNFNSVRGESELTRTRLVSQSKRREELEERREEKKKMNGGYKASTISRKQKLPQ